MMQTPAMVQVGGVLNHRKEQQFEDWLKNATRDELIAKIRDLIREKQQLESDKANQVVSVCGEGVNMRGGREWCEGEESGRKVYVRVSGMRIVCVVHLAAILFDGGVCVCGRLGEEEEEGGRGGGGE